MSSKMLMAGFGPHNPKYLRGLDILGGCLIAGGAFAISLFDYDHSANDMLGYQRWLFPKVDYFFGVTEADLRTKGWEPKHPWKFRRQRPPSSPPSPTSPSDP